MPQEVTLNTRIGDEQSGKRLDQALAELWPEYSRSRLQGWIRDGFVSVDGAHPRPRDKVLGGEEIIANLPEPQAVSEDKPQNIALDIIYEDEDLIVVNKPAGLVAHPAAGNHEGTLVNALLHHDGNLAALPRAGLIHRLDKDTTGLLVVARSLRAHTSLVAQLQEREFKRMYEAVAAGLITAGGFVDEPIGRHPVHRKRMAVVASGKPSLTHYRVIKKFRAHTHLSLQLETGRTHQIRVHMAHRRHPLLGDQTYGPRPRLPKNPSPTLIRAVQTFHRQALHARSLGFAHPANGEWVEWEAPLPHDMARLIEVLTEDLKSASES